MRNKDNKCDIDNILNMQYDDCLSEFNFYPPTDNRILESYIEDIDGGDNFADYCEYIFEILEEEDYYN